MLVATDITNMLVATDITNMLVAKDITNMLVAMDITTRWLLRTSLTCCLGLYTRNPISPVLEVLCIDNSLHENTPLL